MDSVPTLCAGTRAGLTPLSQEWVIATMRDFDHKKAHYQISLSRAFSDPKACEMAMYGLGEALDSATDLHTIVCELVARGFPGYTQRDVDFWANRRMDLRVEWTKRATQYPESLRNLKIPEHLAHKLRLYEIEAVGAEDTRPRHPAASTWRRTEPHSSDESANPTFSVRASSTVRPSCTGHLDIAMTGLDLIESGHKPYEKRDSDIESRPLGSRDVTTDLGLNPRGDPPIKQDSKATLRQSSERRRHDLTKVATKSDERQPPSKKTISFQRFCSESPFPPLHLHTKLPKPECDKQHRLFDDYEENSSDGRAVARYEALSALARQPGTTFSVRSSHRPAIGSRDRTDYDSYASLLSDEEDELRCDEQSYADVRRSAEQGSRLGGTSTLNQNGCITLLQRNKTRAARQRSNYADSDTDGWVDLADES